MTVFSGAHENKAKTISHQQIAAQRFEKSRRGYDTAEVEQFLLRVAMHVESLEKQLAQRATDKTALDLLKNAERIAHDTRLGAEIDANRERSAAAGEVEQARLTAAGIVEDGRSEAARLVNDAHAQAAAIHHGAKMQSEELRKETRNVSVFITDSVSDLRLGASRLVTMANQLESQLAERADVTNQPANDPGPAVIDLTDSATSNLFVRDTSH